MRAGERVARAQVPHWRANLSYCYAGSGDRASVSVCRGVAGVADKSAPSSFPCWSLD